MSFQEEVDDLGKIEKL